MRGILPEDYWVWDIQVVHSYTPSICGCFTPALLWDWRLELLGPLPLVDDYSLIASLLNRVDLVLGVGLEGAQVLEEVGLEVGAQVGIELWLHNLSGASTAHHN